MRLLTPNEIRTCEIGTHRLREGYDTNEVDEILDSVADTMDVLAAEIFRLRSVIHEHGIGMKEEK